MHIHQARLFLTLECLLISIVMPVVFYYWNPRGALFASLWLLTAYAVVILKRRGAWRWKDVWNGSQMRWVILKPMLFRFVLSAVVLTSAVIMFEPHRLFSFVGERPVMWAIVMAFYPLLSALPQEVIFRVFFMKRYAGIVPHGVWMFVVNAFVFGFAHIMFHNWVAVVLCFIGGYFFAQTYERTKSLAVVWLEHALYGNFLFTIGLGWYFYTGAAHLH